MTLPELRVFLQKWFCGCGRPATAVEALRTILALHPLYEDGNCLETLIPNEGVLYLTLYTLDRFDLTEHGSGIRFGWLTDKGTAVLAALEREKATDGYDTLFAPACVHGQLIDGACAECERPG